MHLVAVADHAHTLIGIDPRYPTVSDETRANLATARRELETEAPQGAAPDPYLAARDGRSGKKPKKGKKAKKAHV